MATDSRNETRNAMDRSLDRMIREATRRRLRRHLRQIALVLAAIGVVALSFFAGWVTRNTFATKGHEALTTLLASFLGTASAVGGAVASFHYQQFDKRRRVERMLVALLMDLLQAIKNIENVRVGAGNISTPKERWFPRNDKEIARIMREINVMRASFQTESLRLMQVFGQFDRFEALEMPTFGVDYVRDLAKWEAQARELEDPSSELWNDTLNRYASALGITSKAIELLTGIEPLVDDNPTMRKLQRDHFELKRKLRW